MLIFASNVLVLSEHDSSHEAYVEGSGRLKNDYVISINETKLLRVNFLVIIFFYFFIYIGLYVCQYVMFYFISN